MIDFVILILVITFLMVILKTQIFRGLRCKECKKRKMCKGKQENKF